MGWGNCGDDSEGRPIGYCHEATCDHPSCSNEIDRGLSYACGGMHGEAFCLPLDEKCNPYFGCEKYFCPEHLTFVHSKAFYPMCKECYDLLCEHEPDDD